MSKWNDEGYRKYIQRLDEERRKQSILNAKANEIARYETAADIITDEISHYKLQENGLIAKIRKEREEIEELSSDDDTQAPIKTFKISALEQHEQTLAMVRSKIAAFEDSHYALEKLLEQLRRNLLDN